MKKLKTWFLQLESGTRKTVTFFAAFILIVLGYLVYDAVTADGFQWEMEGKGTLYLILFFIVVIMFTLWKSVNSKGK